jgi:triphosphatase
LSEVELKLEIAPQDMERLLNDDLLGTPAATALQHSIYFDTPDNGLFLAGFTLRIRQEGGNRIQTIKATGPSASIFARSEWETPVTDDTPVIDHSNPLLSEFGEKARGVEPKFAVTIERRTWSVVENGSTIEIALDRGEAQLIDRTAPILELELELKGGAPEALFVLARKIEAVVPIRFGVLSKAERGFGLLEAVRIAVKAEPIELEREASTKDAFKAVASSCFRQFRLNETILRSQRNVESLHQARVALRRLRSAITLFKPLLRDTEAKRLSGEFRWLTGVLGEARNLDVLLPKAEHGELRDALTAKRRDAYTAAIDALDSSRARALMLDFTNWLHCGGYLSDPATKEVREQPAAKFAREALDKARKKLKKHGNGLAGVDDERRHEARKDAKKLRYAAEFFRSLFTDKKEARRYKRFIRAMEGLQDELGDLNDLATGPEVLESCGVNTIAGASDLVSHSDKATLISRAQQALDDILDCKRFWR